MDTHKGTWPQEMLDAAYSVDDVKQKLYGRNGVFYVDLSKSARLLYLAIRSIERNFGYCQLSLLEIGQLTGMSLRNLRVSLRALEKARLVHSFAAPTIRKRYLSSTKVLVLMTNPPQKTNFVVDELLKYAAAHAPSKKKTEKRTTELHSY